MSTFLHMAATPPRLTDVFLGVRTEHEHYGQRGRRHEYHAAHPEGAAAIARSAMELPQTRPLPVCSLGRSLMQLPALHATKALQWVQLRLVSAVHLLSTTMPASAWV